MSKKKLGKNMREDEVRELRASIDSAMRGNKLEHIKVSRLYRGSVLDHHFIFPSFGKYKKIWKNQTKLMEEIKKEMGSCYSAGSFTKVNNGTPCNSVLESIFDFFEKIAKEPSDMRITEFDRDAEMEQAYYVFDKNLKTYRMHLRGMSVNDLSDLLEVDSEYMTWAEAGKPVSYDLARDISEFYGLPLFDIESKAKIFNEN